MNHGSILQMLRRGAAAAGSFVDVVAGGALVISSIMAFVGVVTRYVLEIATWWVYPVQHYTYIYLIFFGAILASRARIHVRVEILDELLKNRLKARLAARLALRLAALAMGVVLVYFSHDFMMWVWSGEQADTVLTWFPLGVVKSLPFVAGIFFCLYLIRDIVQNIASLARVPQESPKGEGQ